jgi:transposase-like protein
MGSKKSEIREASARLRKRLKQIRACEQSGGTLKAYAAQHGISVHALYQAKKQARKRGLLPAHGSQKARPKRSPRPRFVQAIASPVDSAPALAWRLRLRSGDVLESSTPLDADVTLRLIDALRDRP